MIEYIIILLIIIFIKQKPNMLGGKPNTHGGKLKKYEDWGKIPLQKGFKNDINFKNNNKLDLKGSIQYTLNGIAGWLEPKGDSKHIKIAIKNAIKYKKEWKKQPWSKKSNKIKYPTEFSGGHVIQGTNGYGKCYALKLDPKVYKHKKNLLQKRLVFMGMDCGSTLPIPNPRPKQNMTTQLKYCVAGQSVEGGFDTKIFPRSGNRLPVLMKRVPCFKSKGLTQDMLK